MENTLRTRVLPIESVQNPIVRVASPSGEDIWLQAKTWVRRFCALIPSFSHFKWMEEVVYPTHYV